MSQSGFSEILRAFGDAQAVVFHGVATTYAEFVDQVSAFSNQATVNGLTRGDVVAIEGVYSPASCALLVALVDLGAVIVPLPPGPEAKRTEFLGVAEVEKAVTVSKDGGLAVTACDRRATHEYYARLRSAGDPGLVLFSSGTTGRSKASVLNFAKLIANYDHSKLRPRRTLAFLSLDHIGGINTLMNTLVNGGCVITVAERTPRAVFSAVAADRVDTLPTTPTFLTMALLSGELERHDLSTLKLITYGTEPMPIQTLAKLNAALPDIRLKQTYGLSEVGILPTVSRSNDSLWMKLGTRGFEHKIVDGILWIRSDMAMLGYLNAPTPWDGEGFFNTQDAVEVDGEYLKVLGRKSEIINVGGEKVYPNEVESVLLELDNVAEATVSGKRSPITGMVVHALLRLCEPEPLDLTRERVRRHCRSRLEAFKVPVVIDVTDRPQHSDRLKKVRVAS